jgi:uncharacterized protein
MQLRPILLGAAITLAGATSGGSCSRPAAAPPTGTVTLGSGTWKVEIALSERDRYQGLSDRAKLADGAGMLFIYPKPQDLTFCMRRCLIPLDIAFLDANGTVVKTHTMRTEPLGEERELYPSVAPAQYALELNAGELKRTGVKEGDQAKFSNIPDAAKAEAGP